VRAKPLLKLKRRHRVPSVQVRGSAVLRHRLLRRLRAA
jgi:hypothetical protein